MKKYEKPTLEVVQIRVEENIANKGNTTIYKLSLTGEFDLSHDILNLMGGAS